MKDSKQKKIMIYSLRGEQNYLTSFSAQSVLSLKFSLLILLFSVTCTWQQRTFCVYPEFRVATAGLCVYNFRPLRQLLTDLHLQLTPAKEIKVVLSVMQCDAGDTVTL